MWPFRKKPPQNQFVNLSPGSRVPKSGGYICNFCMEGGMMDLAVKLIARELGMHVPADIRSARRMILESGLLTGNRAYLKKPMEGQEVVKSFREGDMFPQCPNCGPRTGWTLLDFTDDLVRKYRRS
jgi:hypothetical protein